MSRLLDQAAASVLAWARNNSPDHEADDKP